jgi:xylulokinase
MTKYVLAVDIGTTSVKAILISSDRHIVAQTALDHHLKSLHPNWAEEDAEVWWENTQKAISTLTGADRDISKNIVAVGVSGMVPAIVLMDQQSRVLRNTIQQNDARAISQIQRLTQEIDQHELFEKTGGKTNQQHILPRLLWVKENEPQVWKNVRCIMGSYDYIAFKLTGNKTIEINWAAESGAFDIRRKEWLADQLSDYGVMAEWLPPVHESMETVGHVDSELGNALGLPAGIPVIAGSADHVASALAAGVIKDGDLLIKFGGAGDILYCVDELKTDERLFFDYHVVPGSYLLNGCMAASGSLIKWFVRDIAGVTEDPGIFKKLDAEAENVPPASDGLIILPYFLGEKTPIFDPTARGVMFGLTLSHTRGHIFRAMLEAVIYGFRHHIDVLTDMGYRPERIFAANGGAKSSFWCQIAADVLGQRITPFLIIPVLHWGSGLSRGWRRAFTPNGSRFSTFCMTQRYTSPTPSAAESMKKHIRYIFRCTGSWGLHLKRYRHSMNKK